MEETVSFNTVTTTSTTSSSPLSSSFVALDMVQANQNHDQNNNNNHNNQQPHASDDTQRLESYHSNIQRIRRILQREATQKACGDVPALGVSENLAKVPVHSLVHFWLSPTVDNTTTTSSAAATVVPPIMSDPDLLSQTLIQAIRLCASLNDYRLLLRLLDAAMSRTGGLEDRVVAEGVLGLSQTSVSLAKIRKFWRRAATFLHARSVNAMLTVLGERHKPGAAVQFLASHLEHPDRPVDSYSLSLVMHILRDSLEQEESSKTKAETNREIGETEKNNGENEDLEEEWMSPCWQWNEGRALLENALLMNNQDFVGTTNNNDPLLRLWNNHVFSALLQLNSKAYEKFPKTHRGPELALQLLEILQQNCPVLPAPDVVTCTHILSCLGREWKVAVQLLQAMQDPSQEFYPCPNVYAYAATAACCARAREYPTALELLQQVQNSTDQEVQPNTIMYNTVLQSLQGILPTSTFLKHPKKVGRRQKADAIHRLKTALHVFFTMQQNALTVNQTYTPDRVTYNTVLAVLANTARLFSTSSPVWRELVEQYPSLFAYRLTEWTLKERLVHTLLDQMEDRGIERDEKTYRQALLSVGSEGMISLVQIVGRMVKDRNVTVTTNLFNSALSIVAEGGDVDSMQLLLGRMRKVHCRLNTQSTTHVIRALGNGGKTTALPVFLLALTDNRDAADHLFNFHKVALDVRDFKALEPEHYSEAIAACLISRDFESARRILIQMKEMKVESTDDSLEAIARSYALMATDPNAAPRSDKSPRVESLNKMSSLRCAESAYTLVGRIEHPSTPLLSLTSKSCAANGMFHQAHTLLYVIHKRMLKEVTDRMTEQSVLSYGLEHASTDKKAIRNLHRSLLRSCANQGNVTAALRFAESIQSFSRKMSWGAPAEVVDTSEIDSIDFGGNSENNTPSTTELLRGTPNLASADRVDMNVPEWKSLLRAASKSGHWRVCLTTLQFIRPYVEATHPDRVGLDEDKAKVTEKEYRILSSTLTDAIKCMAMRSQYAWILRSIDDWIEWSGRRPPKQALAAAFRILCARGRGEEVHSLLIRCLDPPSTDPERDGASYELYLFISAISALHKSGLYNSADYVFASAVSRNALPFNLETQTHGTERTTTLDLHGMNVAVANSAVRVALQQKVSNDSYRPSDTLADDMIIVTGRGINSALQMRPVLRPEVQRMLVEEFYPPLGTSSVPGNMGALRVSADDIASWLTHQREQKGARLLTVAAVLKNLSSGNSLRAAFNKAAEKSREENGEAGSTEVDETDI